ncbi:hypothetical protein Tsp_07116 [Trichinella spiralis]|uniref:hypothetical protein n=1 Tax=Trichinella spiralis TaxID=6334 RepID=UPI0001EFBB69|nr:hypothetical protein Tsp_07116 [Trichinella spiralis]
MVIHAGRCHPAGVKTLIVKEKRDSSVNHELIDYKRHTVFIVNKICTFVNFTLYHPALLMQQLLDMVKVKIG